MSKERQQRRAAREALAAKEAEARAARLARQERGRALGRKVRSFFPASAAGPAARTRRRRTITVAALFLAVQFAAWLLPLTGFERLGVLVVSLLVTPVAAALTFGR